MSDLNSSGIRSVFEPHLVWVEDRLRRYREAKAAPQPATFPTGKLLPIGAMVLAGILVFTVLAQFGQPEPGRSSSNKESNPTEFAYQLESLEAEHNRDGEHLVGHPRDIARWKKFLADAEKLGYSDDVAMASEMLAKLE